MKTIAFFNNKGGVGKTSLAYHLAWMFSQGGMRVLVADLDPQANLTSMFLEDDALLDLWDDTAGKTIYSALRPLIARKGDIAQPHIERIGENLGLLAGELALSRFEDLLSENWVKCLAGEEGAFRVVTAFHRLIDLAAEEFKADLVLIDVGPNLGAINRSALLAAEHIVLPLAPDLFSLQGMKNLGPSLRAWRREWQDRLARANDFDEEMNLPAGEMRPAGYVVMQHSIRDSRPVKAYQRWIEAVPTVYREAVLNQKVEEAPTVDQDPYRLALLKHYRSLMPMAMDAHKPMFMLKPSDGAIGAHVQAVQDCFKDFQALARRLADHCGIEFE
jgi:cellulose biosynthesis protein BcsQ